jgi:tRNA G10  N-methylase Trm11
LEKGQRKHICPGHWEGYRFAVQQFAPAGGWVLDPTVGTGSAIVESINNGRNAVGIELEFPDITEAAVALQTKRKTATGKGEVIQGDARNCDRLLKDKGYSYGRFDLIVNGTPYPVLGGNQSDAPERKANFDKTTTNNMILYENQSNVGILKGEKYWQTVHQIYSSALKFLKVGGKFCIIIKDPINKKKPYLLHKMIIDRMMETERLKLHGCFLHRHLPQTMFMNTYPKRFPNVKIPLYQTGIVMEKI